MDIRKFYVTQMVIDDLRSKRKKCPKDLKNILIAPNASNFCLTKRLNLLELMEFYNLLDLKITKKMVIEVLELIKYSFILVDKNFNLPITYLQKISDFIEDHKNLLSDGEYKSDMEYLASFY